MLRGLLRWFWFGGGPPDPLIFTVERSFAARTRTDSFDARTVTHACAGRTRTDTLSG